VTPVGNPDAIRVTLPVNPPTGTIVTVSEPLLFCATMSGLGDAVSEKLGGGFTVKAIVVVAVTLP
jgi:hypothetical protein